MRNKVKNQMGIPDDAPEFLVGKVREAGGKIGDGKKKLPTSVQKRLEKRFEMMFFFWKEGPSLTKVSGNANEIWT